jgi:hypothetical protein
LLRVHTASDEFGALTHDLRQSRFASLVHERQVVQLNDASARVTFAVSFSPGRPELGYPPTNQATRERPSLLVKRILNSAPRLRLFFADQTLQESASGAFVSGSAVRLCLWRSAIRERSMNDSKLIC